MQMTFVEVLITMLMVILATAATRFLSFIIFPAHKTPPKYITYLGTVLPYAIIGMLVIYSLKDGSIYDKHHMLPEFISMAFIIIIHKIKKNTLLSIALGTIFYMILVQTVFI